MATDVVRVKGYRELLRALQYADKQTKKAVREEIRKAGEGVRRGATDRFTPYSAKSAAGYRVRVRQSGVSVEQSLRKTTGTNPGWGKKQMRVALIPARSAEAAHLEHDLERALDRIATHF